MLSDEKKGISDMVQMGLQDKVEEDLRQRLHELEMLSQRDALTGLWNRNYLKEQVNEHLSVSGHHGVMFMMDLDNFKMINDIYGHIMGDACLVGVSEILTHYVREQDIVCRLGGDEFVLFFKGEMSEETVADRAAGLVEALSEGIDKMNIQGEVSISIGIAMAPQDGGSFMELYKKADKALYHVKNRGKNGFCFYSGGSEKKKKSTEKGKQADMDLIKQLISERKAVNGAYQIEYDGFRRIYQFLTRYMDRSNQNIHMILFSVVGNHRELPDSSVMNGILYELERVIKESLRIGDVATNYSSTQFLVILMDATEENAEMVAERIVGRCQKLLQTYELELEYDVERITAEG